MNKHFTRKRFLLPPNRDNPNPRSERFQHEGQVAAKPLGGDHASHRIEAHADLILGLYEARPEIFLRELCDAVSGHGVRTNTSSLWRFFRRHRITRKKGRFTQLNKNGRM